MNELAIGPLHAVELGRGPTVLCLHGIGSSARSFQAQLDGLSDRYHVVAWDAPGYGASQDPAEDHDMAGYARAAATVAERTNREPVALLGVSWGGVIATRLALMRPDLVAALVLVGSNVGAGADRRRAEAMKRRAEVFETLGAEEYARGRVSRLLSPAAPEELAERVRAGMVSDIRAAGFVRATRAMAATNHSAELARLDVPTLVLAGEHDGVTGVEQSRELVSLIPGATLAVIPDAGHLANQEQPAACNALVRDFLANVSFTPSALRAP